MLYDVIIVGGGPAGLNAAVVLGRCQRRVLLFDYGNPRNARSPGIHNYLTRDCILATDFLKRASVEVRKYGVSVLKRKVLDAKKISGELFEIVDEKSISYRTKKLLIATGLKDRLPRVEGIEKYYGRSVFHCPYCDGWEMRNKKLAVYARNKNGTELALSLKAWSPHVVLLTDGRNQFKEDDRQELLRNGITIITDRIRSLKGTSLKLKSIEFFNGRSRPCEALFFVNGFDQHSDLAMKLGCITNRQGCVITNRMQETNIRGLYVAGDASKDVQFVAVAAAEGAKAGVAINKDLQKELSSKK